jgi:histone arginine demethylase JMJD6
VDQMNERFKDRLYKVGEDDDGYKLKAKLKYFVQYMKYNKDDSPLYIFDGNFDGDGVSRTLLEDYKVPSYFTDDLFHLVGERKRPPYRWVLFGPERSGSSVHIDPLATSAWNTVLQGHKRWVLFPPETPRSIAKGLDVIKKGMFIHLGRLCLVLAGLGCPVPPAYNHDNPNGSCNLRCFFSLAGEDDEAINYFVDLLPRIREKHGGSIKIYECIQQPGETIFVPGGWWHGVLNLDDTVAVTQVSLHK